MKENIELIFEGFENHAIFVSETEFGLPKLNQHIFFSANSKILKIDKSISEVIYKKQWKVNEIINKGNLTQLKLKIS